VLVGKYLTPELMDRKRVTAALTKIGAIDALRAPNILVSPTEAKLTEVRFEESFLGKALVVKVTDETVYREEIFPRDRSGSKEIRTYELNPRRIVNIARLHENGTLEIRISQYAETDNTGPYLEKGQTSLAFDDVQRRYERLVARFRKFIAPILPNQDFTAHSLARAKLAFWKEYSEISDRIRFSNTTVDDGHTVAAKFMSKAGARGASIRDQTAVVKSADALLADGALLDTHNMQWLRREGEKTPAVDVHVRLAGLPHEFAVLVNCTRQDYEYVLRDITRYNR
jgi:hypothetical protein